MAFRPYGPGTPSAQELAARAAAAAGLRGPSGQPLGDAERKCHAARDEAERESLARALDGVEGQYEQLLHGAHWVTQQPAYREHPNRGGLRRGWVDPEVLLFAALWPEGIPDSFPDPARPWDVQALGRWFAQTATARSIPHAKPVERRREYRGLFGKPKVRHSREAAWIISWVIGARTDKPGSNAVAVFADGHVQFLVPGHNEKFELGGLATMAHQLRFPEERAIG